MLVVSTRAYEMMIIVDGDEEDAKVDEVVSKVEAWLTEGGSRLATTDKWGKRKFAYEINTRPKVTTWCSRWSPSRGTWPRSSGPSVSRTKSSATSSSACLTTRRPAVASSKPAEAWSEQPARVAGAD